LIAGHILADDGDKEIPLIPKEIMEYSIAQKSTVNEDMTLRLLVTPFENISDIPNSEKSTDAVIR